LPIIHQEEEEIMTICEIDRKLNKEKEDLICPEEKMITE
jgi:hypothetical protein